MWAMRNKDGTLRVIKCSASSSEKRCFICGQYFKTDDSYVIIVPPFELKKKYSKLSNNFLCHSDEWKEFVKNINSEEELLNKILNHKMPHKRQFTDEELKRMECFCKACDSIGFYVEFKKPYGVKKQKRGTSLYLEYNVFSDKIRIDSRAKEGLFDIFYKEQIIANVYNKMHEFLGDGKVNPYNCNNEIDKMDKEIRKMIDKFN